ncbi:hypothetical protein L1279_000005 [Planomicrobium sp. HSC-17F08]|nr:hypothetical protein [Planomicrobium sp. HSC-17F08]
MKVIEKFFITVPNVAFAWGTKYHLTDDEFMLYSHLQFMRQGSQWNQTFTSVDMIINYLKLGTTNKQRDKDKIIKNLNGLVEKGYITIEYEGSLKKNFFTAKQVQEILSSEFVVEFEEDGKTRKFKGFTKITGKQYNLANNEGRALMTIAYLSWREKIEYKIPKSEWTKVLTVATSTLEDSFKDYNGRFLRVIEGKYYNNEQGQIRQGTNSYEIVDGKNQSIDLNEKAEKVKVEGYLNNLRNKVTDEFVSTNNDIFMQIFDKKTFIKFNGFKVWMETSCSTVKASGQKKLDAMRKSQNKVAGEVVERLEREYQESLLRKGKQKEFMKQFISDLNFDDEYTSDENFISSYKSKEKLKSASLDFFDD